MRRVRARTIHAQVLTMRFRPISFRSQIWEIFGTGGRRKFVDDFKNGQAYINCFKISPSTGRGEGGLFWASAPRLEKPILILILGKTSMLSFPNSKISSFDSSIKGWLFRFSSFRKEIGKARLANIKDKRK